MKIYNLVAVAAFGLVVISSCAKKTEAEQFAEKLCSCSTKMVEVYKKMEPLKADSTKVEETKKMFQEFMAESQKMQTCYGDPKELEAKFKNMTEEQRKKFDEEINAYLKKNCLDFYKLVKGEK
jgi:hypothetical protein